MRCARKPLGSNKRNEKRMRKWVSGPSTWYQMWRFRHTSTEDCITWPPKCWRWFFKSYTYRIGKEIDELWSYCGEMDTAEHTVFNCIHWDDLWNKVQMKFEVAVRIGNFEDVMVERWEQRGALQEMLNNLMKVKECKEYRRI